MAKLASTLFTSFIASAKYTGRMIVKRGEEIPEIVEDFVSGFMGTGWKIWKRAGRWILEIDDLVVRKTMTIFELLIQKIRAVKGAIAITQANGKVASVTITESEILLTIEDDMSFVDHDIILCQVFTGANINRYHVEISKVEGDTIHIPIEEFDFDYVDGDLAITNSPKIGDDIVQFGNSSYLPEYKGRHSAIYLHSDESGQPAIDLLEDIYSKDWSNCVKTRIGGAIPGTTDKRGFYTVNGMIKGVDGKGSTMYYINPDGEASFAQNAALFKPDKSGHIAGGAIAWRWDADRNKYVTTMGDVILSWDNLSQEAKDNLKGEPGRPGEPGKPGGNGVSIIWKGDLPQAPANPQNGWAYKNTTDKKSYVYQDDAWYVMTVDGIDGKNGDDGLSIVWKGESPTPPENPQKNWAYKDTDNGIVYIYNGSSWSMMVLDGSDGTDGTDGTDGFSVFITYHDSIAEPAKPTGNGTSGGWHTNATSDVVWISQKVAADAMSGTWSPPIKIKGMDGTDANLLPWIEKWNGYATELGEEYIVTPKMFSGTKSSNGKLTGIAQGKDCITIDGVNHTGIFALVDNKIMFAVEAGNGDVTIAGEAVAKAISASGLNIDDMFIIQPGGRVSAKNCIFDGVFAEGFICSRFSTSYENTKDNEPKTMNFIVKDNKGLDFELPNADRYLGAIISIYLDVNITAGNSMRVGGISGGSVTYRGISVLMLIRNRGTFVQLMSVKKNGSISWELINFDKNHFSFVTITGDTYCILDRSKASIPEQNVGSDIPSLVRYWDTI